MIVLKYPVLFVHGMGFRDNKHISYWGRIPRVFEDKGGSVYYGCQDSNADIETNGLHIANRCLKKISVVTLRNRQRLIERRCQSAVVL